MGVLHEGGADKSRCGRSAALCKLGVSYNLNRRQDDDSYEHRHGRFD